MGMLAVDMVPHADLVHERLLRCTTLFVPAGAAAHNNNVVHTGYKG